MRQKVVDRSAFGKRAEAAGQLQDRREGDDTEGADERVLDQWTASHLRGIATCHDRLDCFAPGLVRGSLPVPVLSHLIIRHQGLGPVDRAETDAQQAQSKSDTKDDIGQVRLPDTRDEPVGLLVDRKVRDQEDDGGHHRDTEQGRDLALCTTGGLFVDVRQAVHVRGYPGIAETLRYAARALDVPLVEAHRGARLAYLCLFGLPVVFVHPVINPVDSQFFCSIPWRSIPWRRMSSPEHRIRSRGL